MAFASNVNGSAYSDRRRTRDLRRTTMARFEGLVETGPVGPARPRGTLAHEAACEVGLTIDANRKLERGPAHMNRAEMVAELAASLAHEITEPIAAVELGAEACLRWIDRDQPALDEVRQALLRIINDAKRAATIIERNRSHNGEGAARAPIEIVAMQ
jgi:signal transduction histidine kinase